MFNNIKYVCKRYSFLLKQLIARDFKVKYKRSVLGIVWSLLYPLLTMSVMSIVFTNVFKMSTPGVNYLSYLMSGLVLFNYFSEASNLALSSVFANFSLINKVYMPKYIFPVSKCLFAGINFLLTLVPLYAILIITGTGVSVYHLTLPYMYVFFLMFTVGVGLILSTVAVFLRDMMYIYGVVITMLQYLTPIMYDPAIIDNPLFLSILKFNPLYWFVYFARRVMLYHMAPEPNVWLYCAIIGVVTLLLGIFIFKKNQNKFIYYA